MKFFKITGVAIIALAIGFSVRLSQKDTTTMDALTLSNVEALSQEVSAGKLCMYTTTHVCGYGPSYPGEGWYFTYGRFV